MREFLYICIVSLLVMPLAYSFNRSLFFRTSSFWDEPRFEKPFLTSFDIQLLGGSNHKGHNSHGTKTNVFSIYGPENIDLLSTLSGKKVVGLPDKPKSILFQGIVDVFEADLNVIQNFNDGFFLHFHLPVLLVRTLPSGYHEVEHRRYRHYQPAWQMTLSSLTPLLDEFGLSACGVRQGGLSDSTLFVGWTHSFDMTQYFDFIDTTVKTGILIPSGKKKNENLIFDIPYGYNGHWAVPFSWDISLGAFEWFTWGFHSDCLFFFEKRQCVRMKTCEECVTGLITQSKGSAEIEPGIVWRLGTYFKADHVYKGLSLVLAFSYEQANKTNVIPHDKRMFNKHHVNLDPRFEKWSRSIVHMGIEYDFTSERKQRGTRLGLFYDHQMTGLRVFDVNTPGGYVGIDVNWSF
jgi:hypothetical protein